MMLTTNNQSMKTTIQNYYKTYSLLSFVQLIKLQLSKRTAKQQYKSIL